MTFDKKKKKSKLGTSPISFKGDIFYNVGQKIEQIKNENGDVNMASPF